MGDRKVGVRLREAFDCVGGLGSRGEWEVMEKEGVDQVRMCRARRCLFQ